MEQLQAEMERRRSTIPALSRRAAELRRQLASVELELKALGSMSLTAFASIAPMKSTAGKKANKASSAARGRKGKGGGPTLSTRIVEEVNASQDPVRLRDLVARVSKAMGREVSKSFLVQMSSTMRRLVDAKAVAQVERGLYKKV